jgi:hypothetical protein
MSQWLQVGVKGRAMWPTKELELQFGGINLFLKPASEKTEQSIHVNLDNISEEEALTIINRFLSVISWCDGQSLENLYGWSGNPCPVPVPREVRMVGSSYIFPFGREIEPSKTAQLALALYREAKTVNSVPFQFLGYFKILNIFWNDKYTKQAGQCRNELIEGIRSSLTHVTDSRALKRISELAATNPDIAEYLYKSGRCAVAHAYSKPLVDPDEIVDIRRLSSDMVIIQEIAENLMKTELGLSRSIIK